MTTTKCPLCNEHASEQSCYAELGTHFVKGWDCKVCGQFYAQTDISQQPASDRRRVSILLRERSLKGIRRPSIRFKHDPPWEGPLSESTEWDDLLAEWPRTVPERLERGFCNLCRFSKQRMLRVGHLISITEFNDARILFTIDQPEMGYLLTAMSDFGWVHKGIGRNLEDAYFITPKGWANFDELTRTERSLGNPVFAAMWFGSRNHKGEKVAQVEQMKKLFDEAIHPACYSSGWKCKRADTDEHNDPIIDRVIADIRVAPFVIAELTENNQGVYFEAGFARGRGSEVIYCCPDGTTPHFDVSGINLVKWKDSRDLRKRLENRILGTIGRGPHKIDAREGQRQT